MARHSPITISSRSMPRAIRRVAAPTKRSRSPSRRMGMGPCGIGLWPVRRSLPPGGADTRSCSPPGCAGMPSGTGRGRCVPGSSAAGCECSEPPVAGNGEEVPPGLPGGPCFAQDSGPDDGASPPARVCAGKAVAGGVGSGSGVRRSAPRGSAGPTPCCGLLWEVGCSVTRVESIRPGLRAVRAVRPAEKPIPGIRVPGTKFPYGHPPYMIHGSGAPSRCGPRTPRSRPAAPR